MTVSVTTTRGVFTGDGVTLIFPFTVPLLQAADLTVYVNSVLQTQGSQYTVSPSGGSFPCTGGNVVFTGGNAPPNLAAGIYIRVIQLTQTTALPIEGSISSPTLSSVFDKATMGLQQLQEEINRSITIPVVTPAGVSTALSLPVASALISWDPTATFLQNITIQQILANAGITFTSTAGQVIGPSPTTPHTVVLWNNTIGTSVKDGPAIGPSGSVLTSNGNGNDPSFQFPFPIVMQGRLSLSSSLPITVNDITGATTIYLLPYLGAGITLWDSTHSRLILNQIPIAGISVSLGSLASGAYDLVVSDATGSGTNTLALVAWTNNTTRATSLVYGTHLQALTLNGDETKRFLGSVFLTGTGVTEHTAGDRALVNYYNTKDALLQGNMASSYTYNTATYRAMNANTTNGQARCSFMTCMNEDLLDMTLGVDIAVATNGEAFIGINLNSATNTPTIISSNQNGNTINRIYTTNRILTVPSIGYNFVQAMESCTNTGTADTFNGASVNSFTFVGNVKC